MTTHTLRLIDEYLTQGGYAPNIDADTLDREAALVAAAPDLLAALDCAEGFIAGFEGDETQEGIDWLLATIRAAITKATGA